MKPINRLLCRVLGHFRHNHKRMNRTDALHPTIYISQLEMQQNLSGDDVRRIDERLKYQSQVLLRQMVEQEIIK